MTIDLTEREINLLLSVVGALLASMATDVPPGQPTPQEMLDVEALQTKLMKVRDGT